MRMLIYGLFGAMSLTGCGDGTVSMEDDCDDCESGADDEWVLLVAEDRDQSATLTIEFSERENQIGQLGWHLTLDCPDVVELNETPDELQEMLDDRGYDIDVDNIECVRWNVNYQDGRFLCEGNAYTTYEADLITDTYFNWSGEAWSIDLWSEPSGEGCSALACND